MNPALIADPYVVLFGALLVLFGASVVLAFLLARHGDLAWPLAAVFGTSAVLWLGLLTLDLSRLAAADLRPSAIDARWVLFPAAIILFGSGTVVLWTYGEHAAGAHAWEYRFAVRLIVLCSVLALFGVLIQPLFAA